MLNKAKKTMIYAPLIALTLAGCSYLANKAQIDSFNQKKSSDLEQRIENEQEYSSDFFVNNKFNEEHGKIGDKTFDIKSFPEIQERYNQLKLIDKAAKADVIKRPLSIDSVAKFTNKETIIEYFKINNLSLNYHEGEFALNRLRALTRSADEIAQDRFAIARTSNRSLNTLAAYLGIKPGAYETNPDNTKAFFELYKDNIIESARKHNIEPAELAGIIKHESGGGSFVVSRTGALGPAQLTSYIYNPGRGSNLDETKNSNPFNPVEAIDRSAEYISVLKRRLRRHDDASGTLWQTAYNQGEPTLFSTLNAARKEGIRQPRQIINYICSNENKHTISKEGRDFSSKVQTEIRAMRPLFESYLAQKN